jgi:hypothetical protein
VRWKHLPAPALENGDEFVGTDLSHMVLVDFNTAPLQTKAVMFYPVLCVA